jgi:hypothetical protein
MDVNIRLFQNYYNFKLINQTMAIIDFMPFIGPIKNASESLLANLSNDHKLARNKAITALVTAAIDLLGLCLGIASIAYLYEKFNKIDTFAIVKDILVMAISITIISFVIGAKIVVDQLVKLLVNNLVGVNTASAAMVNSVTITAAGIEAVVGTVSNVTYGMVFGVKNSWKIGYNSAKTIIYTPIKVFKTTTQYVNNSQRYAEEKIVKKSKQAFIRVSYNLISFIHAIITLLLVITALLIKTLTNTRLTTKIFHIFLLFGHKLLVFSKCFGVHQKI